MDEKDSIVLGKGEVMLSYSNIAQKIPKTARQKIIIIALVVLGSLCFTALMKSDFFENTFNTLVFLLALMIIYVTAQFAEYKHLSKKTRDILTKKEIKYYVFVNYLLVGGSIAFGIVLLVI